MKETIPWSDRTHILFIESYDNYVKVFKSDFEYDLYRRSLAWCVEIFSSNVFLRIHQKHIINLLKVEDYKGNAQGYYVRLRNSSNVLKVSRKYADVFKTKMELLLESKVTMTRNDPGYLFF